MVHFQTFNSKEETARFLEEKCDIQIIGITQEVGEHFTVFYKY